MTENRQGKASYSLTETLFTPSFYSEKLYWYQNIEKSNENTVSEKVLNYVEPGNSSDNYTIDRFFICKESDKEYPPPSFLEFLTDTSNLIFKMTDQLPNINYYAKYCEKYGSLFYEKEQEKKELGTFISILTSFHHLRFVFEVIKGFIQTDFQNDLYSKLADMVESEHQKTAKTSFAFFPLYRPNQKFHDLPKSGYYQYRQYGLISHDGSKLSRPFFFLILCSITDLSLLRNGTALQKTSWLKQQILDTLSDQINRSHPIIKTTLENNIPKVTVSIPDRLSCFLLNLLSNESDFHICPAPGCGKVIMGKKKYCCRSHMDSYKKSLPEEKIKNLISKWCSRKLKTRLSIPIKFQDGLTTTGLNHLKSHSYEETVKHLQIKREEILAKIKKERD